MKKVILLLMIAILSIALTGCNKQEDNTSPVPIDKTTDNDVKNIINSIYNPHDLTFTMDDHIRGIQRGYDSFYLCEINDKEYDIICAYIDEEKYEADRFRDSFYYSQATWYKLDKTETLKDRINGLKLTGVFGIFDALITQDIINEKEYNYKCKYYKKISSSYSHVGELLDDFTIEYNNLIIYTEKKYIENNSYVINDSVYDLNLRTGFETRSNINGKKKVVFKYTIYGNDEHYNTTIYNIFGETYEYFAEWLIDEKDYVKIETFKDGYKTFRTEKKAYIDLDKFRELIKEIELDE